MSTKEHGGMEERNGPWLHILAIQQYAERRGKHAVFDSFQKQNDMSPHPQHKCNLSLSWSFP